MRANEFIKENGIEKARELYNSDDWSTVSEIFLHDLRLLIDSHEIVGNLGGLDCVKFKLKLYESVSVVNRLKQAIADVESCQ